MRAIASSVAFHYVGLPYIWGGDDAISGFDCSGFVQEPLKSVGKYDGVDRNAAGIFIYYRDLGKEVSIPVEGCLIFYAKNDKINHVEYYWKDGLTIGASGGRSTTKVDIDFTTKIKNILGTSGLDNRCALKIADILGSEDAKLTAAKQNAYIKIRPMRKDVFAIVDPFK